MGVACLQNHQECANRHRHGSPPEQHHWEARCGPDNSCGAAGSVQHGVIHALQPAAQAGMHACLSAQVEIKMLATMESTLQYLYLTVWQQVQTDISQLLGLTSTRSPSTGSIAATMLGSHRPRA